MEESHNIENPPVRVGINPAPLSFRSAEPAQNYRANALQIYLVILQCL
jgi:hypothetical protein